jgi:hypothetical protein
MHAVELRASFTAIDHMPARAFKLQNSEKGKTPLLL